MKDRIHKILAAHGIGSRREIERWIAAGRITVGGRPAVPGQAIGPGDDVRLDGRRLRLRWQRPPVVAGLAYHRPAGEAIRAAADGMARCSIDRLPKAASGRWIPIQPMGPGEGGLELFVNDGTLARALTVCAVQMPVEFSVRVRGQFTDTSVRDVLDAADGDPALRGGIAAVEFAGGEGANRWVTVVGQGLRPRELRQVFERCGLEVNRILRTRLGPLRMDRPLRRGSHRALTADELGALYALTGLAREAGPQAGARHRAGKIARGRRAAPTRQGRGRSSRG